MFYYDINMKSINIPPSLENDKIQLIKIDEIVLNTCKLIILCNESSTIILFTIEGTSKISHNNNSINIKNNDFIAINLENSKNFEIETKNLTEAYLFQLKGPLLATLIESYELEYHFAYSLETAKSLLHQILQAAETKASGIHKQTALLLHEIFIDIHANEKQSNSLLPDHIHVAKRYMDKYLDSQLNMADIANHTGFSEGHLIRSFKKYLGYTPSQYLNKQRLKEAKDLLLQSSDSIAEIAKKLRYQDKFYFSTAFKKHFGLSPSYYRKRYYSS